MLKTIQGYHYQRTTHVQAYTYALKWAGLQLHRFTQYRRVSVAMCYHIDLFCKLDPTETSGRFGPIG